MMLIRGMCWKWKVESSVVASQEIDMGAAAFSITYARSLVIDYSTPIFLDVTGLLIPFPEENSKALASIQPYPASVGADLNQTANSASSTIWIKCVNWWVTGLALYHLLLTAGGIGILGRAPSVGRNEILDSSFARFRTANTANAKYPRRSR